MHMPNVHFVDDRQWQSSIYKSEDKPWSHIARSYAQNAAPVISYIYVALDRLYLALKTRSNLPRFQETEYSPLTQRILPSRGQEQISDMWPTASRCLEITPRSPVDNTERR